MSGAFSRLLVGVDGSPGSVRAAALAIGLARGRGLTRLRFVSALDTPRILALVASGDALPDGGEIALDAARAGCRDAVADAVAAARRAGADAEGEVLEGEPVAELLAEAQRWEASCVVTATHGREGLARALLGSVAEGVLRRSTIPVLVVHDLPAVAEHAVLRRIVCALDASPPADRAFAVAVDVAAEREATLELLSIVALDDEIAEDYEHRGFDPEGTVGALYATARTPLDERATRARARGVETSVRVAGAQDVARAIVATASDRGADLVVIGTHGRHGLERAFLGSTAEAVIRRSAVPVLAVRS